MTTPDGKHPWKNVRGYGGLPPCGDCSDRHVGCQIDCERYLEYKSRIQDKKEKRQEYFDQIKDMNEFRKVGVQRVVKRRGK